MNVPYRAISDIVVSIGVGAVVKNAVDVTTPDNLGKIKKVFVGVGSMVIGSMVSDKATQYTNRLIDNATEQYKKSRSERLQKEAEQSYEEPFIVQETK